MPRTKPRTRQHTAKADRMAERIEKSAKTEGRYKGREKEVAWRKVHKELPKGESHKAKGGKPNKAQT